MVTRKSLLGAATCVLAAGLIAGTSAASAQTASHGRGAPLKGTVQNLGSSSFQLQTSTSTVNVSFTAQTHVQQVTAGTTKDLTANTRVSLKLQSGTTTVTAITIQPAFNKPTTGTTTGGTKTHPVHTHPTSGTTGTTWPTKGTGTTKPTKPTKPTGTKAAGYAGGVVASLNGNTLTLKTRGGTSVPYTLAANVKITKVVSATTNALANNETVQVEASSTGAAREITVLVS